MSEILSECCSVWQQTPLNERIQLVIALFTALAAGFAGWAASQALRANVIATKSSLRAERLAIFRTLSDFLHYCSTYCTMLSMKAVDGTRHLSSRTHEFKWETRPVAFLRMPRVQDLVKTAIAKANELQRVLGRSSDPNPKPIDPTCRDVEENIDKLVEWFAEQERNLPTVIDLYM